MTKYQIYKEMFNNCKTIEEQIRAFANKKNHTIYNSVDVYVENEDKREYFVDFEARNKSGNYYRIRGAYTIEDMKKTGIIEK